MERNRSKLLAQSLGIEDPGYKTRKSNGDMDNNLWSIVSLIILTIATLFVLNFGIVLIDGKSMNSTLEDGEIHIFRKFGEPEIGDIVVVEERLTDDYPSHHIIKRLVGKSGDVLRVQSGHLYRNGELVEEPYINRSLAQEFAESDWEITIPEGYIFIMGDNRDASKDSRQVGSFKEEAVRGIVYY